MKGASMSISIGFSHIVVNVRDLEHSISFYESMTPLRCSARTLAPVQPFATLGVAQGQFSGALLRDPALPLGPAVHLVQWLTPKPTGRPYPGFTNPGFFRICFQCNDVAATYDRVVAAGARPFTAPLPGKEENAPGYPVFGSPDPDGIVVQYLRLPGLERLFHVCCNCSELASAVRFYEALGLRCYMRMSTTEPEPFSFGPPGALGTFEAAVFDHPAEQSPDQNPNFSIDLVRWKTPEPQGVPYASQVNLGIARIGLAARDLDQARASLRALGYPVSEVEQRDFGTKVGTRRAMVVKNPDGALIELVDERI
jgi:catechol 2,3-dioxygenase-like lactoylglutathione lyase family enzyme